MTREPSKLDLLAEDWVKTLVDLSPEFATYAGFKVGEDRLEDTSPEAAANYNKLEKDMLAKVEATGAVFTRNTVSLFKVTLVVPNVLGDAAVLGV